MSLRPRPAPEAPTPTASLRQAAPSAMAIAAGNQPATSVVSMINAGTVSKEQVENALQTIVATHGAPTVTYDQLTPTEKAIAQLQVDQNEVGGIKWVNDAHYESLKASNNIHTDLDRRLTAYKEAKSTALQSAA